MQWLELTIDTLSGSIDAAAAALTAGGFDDLVIEDQQEYESFLDQNKAYWDYIDETLQSKLQGLSCIKLYLEASDTAGMEKLKVLLEDMKAQGGFGSLDLTVKPLADVNWEESWKDNYPPQQIGDRLVVLPYWLSDTDTQGRLPVILDPGLTFGTGAHPSTQMVMEFMENAVRPGMHCLDLGSGSGILSIAALRLGAAAATGVDIDAKAEGIARENALYNGFSAPEFTALTGNVLTDTALMESLLRQRWDVVLVNIVADVIIALSPVLPRFLDENTLLICSGILDTRLEDVKSALSSVGLTVTQVRAKEDWRSITAQRRAL